MAKTGRKKYESVQIFDIFPKYQNGRKVAIFRATMQIFSMIHRINMKKVSSKFYDNNLNGSSFRNFRHTKYWPYLGNYNR